MDDLLMLEGPVPAWFIITDTSHGLECATCRSTAGSAAVHARVYGSSESTFITTDGDDINHSAVVTRLS